VAGLSLCGMLGLAARSPSPHDAAWRSLPGVAADAPMRIDFDERFRLPLPEVESYFRTPADWVRLYGLAGRVEERGGGWIAVPLAGFPFPLVAKTVAHEPGRCVRWVFRGFWRGRGEVHLDIDAGRTRVQGFEEIAVRPLGPLSRLLERTFLERRFRAIWALGWGRLRKREGGL
jgi:hypothetical protein